MKGKYIVFSMFLPLLAVVLLVSSGWLMGTAGVAPASAQGALCEVETTGDNTTDFSSANATALQNAVNAAPANALIKVAGTCAGVQLQGGFVQTVYINKGITIQGGYTSSNWLADSDPVAFPTILDAQQNGRVVYITAGNKIVVLDGLTITGGNVVGGDGGGIIANSNVQWTLANSTVSQSKSVVSGINGGFGGGIYNSAAHFVMDNSTVSNNTAGVGGGGLYTRGSIVVDITGSTIENNSAPTGGGIHLENNTTLTIDNSFILNNHASVDGGGLANDSNTGKMNLIAVTVAGNTAGDSGAGIFNNGELNIDNSSIVDNEAVDDGGGLLNHTNGKAMIINSVIENNRVDSGGLQASRGAGIYNRAFGFVTVQASVLRQNSAADNGGGIWNQGTFTLESSTLEGNTSAVDGGGIWNDGSLTINASNILSNTVPLDGGGIHNTAELNISDSTLAYNEANDGGAIYSTGLVTVTTVSVSGSTIHDNQAGGFPPTRGGGVYINSGKASIVNSTLSHNSSGNEGAALVNNGAVELIHTTIVSNSNLHNLGVGTALYNLGAASVLTLTNSAIAYNSGLVPDTDCAGVAGSTVIDNGYNLVEDGTCITAGTSFSGDPMLGSLADNGGNTPTHLPLPFSPVIDHIPAASCAAADDQIGVARPVDAACDIGSVELAVNYGPPVAVADTYAATEDTVLTVTAAAGVLINDLDPDFGPITAVLDTDVVSGTLLLNSDGSFNYTPDLNFCGTDSFTYLANDGLTNSTPALVTLNVACTPDLPIAVNDTYTTTENTPLTILAPGVLNNDSDPDGDALTAVLDTDVMTGTLTLNADGSFDYTPLADWTGVTTFTYHVEANGDSSNIATVSLLVGHVNDPPVAVNDSYATDEDTPLNVPAPGVLNNDSDADGDLLTAVLVEDVAIGTLTLNSDGSFDYTPPADWSGVTTFTYQANDGLFNSNTAVVTLSVAAVNDTPAATADSYTATEDVSLVISAPGVLGNDNDIDGDPLTAVLDTDVASGVLTLNSNGSFTYTPDANFCGTDSFTYHAHDGEADSNTVTVTLNVTCVNDAPMAVEDSYSTPQDTPLVIAAPGILGNDSDVDGNSLTAILDSGVLTGTLEFSADGSFTYMPPSGWSGTTTFTYHANDGQLNSTTVVVTLVVDYGNSPPVAVDDSYTTSQGTPLSVAAPGVLANDSDVDGDSLTAVLDTNVTNGSLTFNSDGSFVYTPNPGFVGMDAFTYTVSDGLATDTATVTITVQEGTAVGFSIYLPLVVVAEP